MRPTNECKNEIWVRKESRFFPKQSIRGNMDKIHPSSPETTDLGFLSEAKKYSLQLRRISPRIFKNGCYPAEPKTKVLWRRRVIKTKKG